MKYANSTECTITFGNVCYDCIIACSQGLGNSYAMPVLVKRGTAMIVVTFEVLLHFLSFILNL